MDQGSFLVFEGLYSTQMESSRPWKVSCKQAGL